MKKKLIAFTDGACVPNPGKGSWAFILRESGSGETITSKAEPIPGQSTNNIAELTAILNAIKTASELDCEELEVRSDSSLAIGVASGAWGAKKPHIRRLGMEIRDAKVASGMRCRFVQISREENDEADLLTQEALGLSEWPASYVKDCPRCSRCSNPVPSGDSYCLCRECAAAVKA